MLRISGSDLTDSVVNEPDTLDVVKFWVDAVESPVSQMGKRKLTVTSVAKKQNNT
jgi:hypothetical protein